MMASAGGTGSVAGSSISIFVEDLFWVACLADLWGVVICVRYSRGSLAYSTLSGSWSSNWNLLRMGVGEWGPDIGGSSASWVGSSHCVITAGL